MNRNHTVFNHLGEQIIPQYKKDVTWDEVRTTRNKTLRDSDWRFMSDQSPSDEWIAYRVFLRDLPQNFFDESDEPSQGANAAADAWNDYEIPE